MVFPTIEFAAFFLVVLCLSWLLMPYPTVWKPFILGASYFFYGYADTRFVLLIIASTLINQAAAAAIHRWRDRRILIAVGAANLGILGWFKYYGFFALSVDRALTDVGLPAPLPLLQVALPIGISFFTFQALSYVIDVHRRRITPAKTIDFAVYEAFFPHLVAGPIVRASEFIPQLASPRDPGQVQATRATFLIVGGLFKKVVLADLLATNIVDPVFDAPSQHSSAEVLAAIYGYVVQVYCDFSAYSDIAIGLALLLGFRFPENFDRPFAAATLRDFWRRWHMTLSRWLRDYLYIPLGGSRRGARRAYVNLLVTMTLGGLWHGAAWTFVIWGFLHGAGLAAERSWEQRRKARSDRQPGRAGRSGRPGRGIGPPGHRSAKQEAAIWEIAVRATPPDPIGTPVGTATEGPTSPTLPVPAPAGETDPLAGPPPGTPDTPELPALPGMPPPRGSGDDGIAGQHGVGLAGAGAAGVRTGAVAATTTSAAADNTDERPSPARRWAGRLLVFHFICATWVLFRSPDLATAAEVFVRLFTASGPAPLVTKPVLLAIAAGLATQAIPRRWWLHAQDEFAQLRLPVQVAAVTAFIVTTYAIAGQEDVAPFIYFRF